MSDNPKTRRELLDEWNELENESLKIQREAARKGQLGSDTTARRLHNVTMQKLAVRSELDRKRGE